MEDKTQVYKQGSGVLLKRQELVEKAKNLATSMLSPSLFMVHDAIRRGKHNIPELSRGEKVGDPLLDLVDADVEAGGDDTAFVKTTDKVDDDLSSAMVIDDLELANVTVGLHDLEKLDDDLGRGSKKNLALATFLGVRKGL